MIYEKYIRVLYIDLLNKKIKIEHRTDLCEYLGGVGVASKLLEENVRPDLDPLDIQQPIIFAIGAASSIFPVITKTVAMFWSPHTRELGESYAGGRMAMMLFLAGYDAVVITGKSEKPCFITIKKNDVEFKDARALWGTSSVDVGRVIREKEGVGGKRSIIRIGTAGENMVSYASVCVDTYRHFGRLGLGAVFGSKNLKAITIVGDRSVPSPNFKEYFKVYQEVYKHVSETEIMSKYHDAGTPINIEPLNAAGGLPTNNLNETFFEYGKEIAGDTVAKRHLVRKMACTGCPVGCIHIGQFRREFDKGHEYEARSVGYDYELLFALGSFLGIKTSEDVLELIDKVEVVGLDAMTTGVVLGWATEALAKGLISVDQTLEPLAFGNTEGYLKAIDHITNKKNAFYEALAQGSDKASDIYGGKEFAMTYAKNEMAGYHTGYGMALGSAVGARHSHLCNGGYSIDQAKKEFDKQKLVDQIFDEEKERCMLNSLIICLFARKVYDRETIIKVLTAIGNPLTNEELTAIGERIYKTKLRIKKMLGFEQKDVKIPKRFFETPSMTGKMDEAVFNELLEMYIKKTDEIMKEEI